MRKLIIGLLLLGPILLSTGCRPTVAPHPAVTPFIHPTGQPYTMLGFEFNPDFEKRDEVLGITVVWGKDDLGGMVHIDSITLQQLETLVEQRFANPDDRQNASPTVSEFLDFMSRYPSAVAYGYAVSPQRPDYRVTVTGLYVESEFVTPELKEAFVEFSSSADEVSLTGTLSCWWD